MRKMLRQGVPTKDWLIVVTAGVVLAAGGCGQELFRSHVDLMDTMRGMAQAATQSLAEGSPVQYMASGQVVEPGVVVEVGQSYYAKSYFKGVGGQLSAAGQGASVRLTDAQQEQVFAIWNSTALSTTEKRQMIMQIIEQALKAVAASRPAE